MAEQETASPRTSRSGDSLISLLGVLLDAAAIEGSFLLSYWLRFNSSLFDALGYIEAGAPPLSGYALGSLFVIPPWLLLFQSRRMYGARRSVALSDELISVGKVVSLGMLMVMSAAFFYRDFSYSRVVFGLLWVNSIVLIFAGRTAIFWFERRLYRKGKHLRQAIILGNDTLASDVYTKLNGHPSFGFMILGYFADSKAPKDERLSTAPYLGGISDAPGFIQTSAVDLVFIGLRSEQHGMLFDFISECEGINVEFMMVPDVLEVLTSQVSLTELEGIPLLRLKSIPFTVWGRISKRALDLVVSSVMIVLLSPFILLIIILIKLDSPGPILFLQERVGLDGWSFTMYKFRSMKVGSELSRATLGVKDDPRRTRVGVWLRKLSMDEIPQLFNVLKGEMSLVGPRPERPVLVEEFRKIVPKYLDRHRVKTGMTGWAQVNGLRGDTSIADRVKYDLYYIENWSLTFDIKILLRTIRATLDLKNVT